jgi:uncharacterized SAM-binding protein YcdF (DUF218 family)
LRRRWLSLLGIAVLLLGAFYAVILYFSVNFLESSSPLIQADAMVVLGGEPQHRPARALELYQQGAATNIVVSGIGDWQETRIVLVGNGVPEAAIQLEPNSRTTRENAKNSIPLLHAIGARRVVIVTSWFHSRRALRCFRHYAPDIQFISLPTTADVPKSHWPDKHEWGWVTIEYAKLLYYWLRFGICPV